MSHRHSLYGYIAPRTRGPAAILASKTGLFLMFSLLSTAGLCLLRGGQSLWLRDSVMLCCLKEQS